VFVGGSVVVLGVGVVVGVVVAVVEEVVEEEVAAEGDAVGRGCAPLSVMQSRSTRALASGGVNPGGSVPVPWFGSCRMVQDRAEWRWRHASARQRTPLVFPPGGQSTESSSLARRTRT
jgi:hypothetical protein